MNRIISFLFFIFISVSVAAGIYEDTRKDGISAFNKGNYEYALKCFESVLRIAPANNDLAAWINRCKSEINKKRELEHERRRREAEERNTYFTISSDSASFDATGGSKSFTVNSSLPWEIKRYPKDWGHLSVTGNTIELSVDAYSQFKPRADYFLVASNSKTLRVGFSQDEIKPIDVSVEPEFSVGTPDVKLDSIRVKHNYLMITERCFGMQFSMKLHCNNINLDSCHIVIYFRDNDGIRLKDKNNRYNDTGGNVAIGKTFYRNTASSMFDCILSFPYEELHFSEIGKKAIKYSITVWDMGSEKPKVILTSPQYVTFVSYPVNVLFPYSIEGTAMDYKKIVEFDYNAVDPLKKIREYINEMGGCQHGAITDKMGVVVTRDNIICHTGIHQELADKLCKLREKDIKINSIAITNSGYFCVTYGGNSWYGLVPHEMSHKLNDFHKRGEAIYCVSISENGSYAIVGNQTSYASNPEFMAIMEKAFNKFGKIEDVCITDLGICLICQKGIYYHNIPQNLEEEIKKITVNTREFGSKEGKMPDHIRFTDIGTYLITNDYWGEGTLCL